MEEDYISISTLNDYIFCPYSIYLHNVYENTDESLFHATPQTQGRIAHETVDEKKSSTRKDVLQVLPVYSEKYGLMGKIDVYGEYRLKRELSQDYYKVFVEALMPHKVNIFLFVQAYYRAFMRNAPIQGYPLFNISS